MVVERPCGGGGEEGGYGDLDAVAGVLSGHLVCLFLLQICRGGWGWDLNELWDRSDGLTQDEYWTDGVVRLAEDGCWDIIQAAKGIITSEDCPVG